MADVVISEFMDPDAIGGLQEQFNVLYEPDLVTRPEALLDALSEARALIVRNQTQVTVQLLQSAPHLTCVGRLGAGLDNIDLDACKARNISVYPATGANNLSVAEYVISSAMVLLRGAYQRTDDVIGGLWPRQDCAGREIAGKVIGFIGFGGISRHTAALASALGMRVQAYDPFVGADDPAWEGILSADMSTILKTSDVVSLHVPLTEQTRGLISSDQLALMKPGAILINTARGGVVDEAALVSALKEQRLGGAALDVFENEPVNGDTGLRFKSVPNLLLTPHIAGVTEESNVRVSRLIANRVSEHLNSAQMAGAISK